MGGGLAPYPWSVILTLAFVYVLVFLALKSDRYPVVGRLYGRNVRKAVIAAAIVMCVSFGLTSFSESWIFYTVMLCLAAAIGMVCVADFRTMSVGKLAALPSHLAMFILLLACTFGQADKDKVVVEAYIDSPVSTGVDHQGHKVDLPFSITLKEFSIDNYPVEPLVEGHRKGRWTVEVLESLDAAFPEALLDTNASESDGYRAVHHIGAVQAVRVLAKGPDEAVVEGWVSPGSFLLEERRLELPGGAYVYYPAPEPRQYTSRLVVRYSAADGGMQKEELETSVNNPASLPGSWKIYQNGFDAAKGRWSAYSTLECVCDPWSGMATVSFWILMVSALLLVVKSIPRGTRKGLWLVIGVLFAVFAAFTFARVGFGSRNLRPALRSHWFVPHVVSYMFAYSLLTVATVYSIFLCARQKRKEASSREMAALDRLVRFGWAFLTLGLVMGALWAKAAWGDFWTWDPKETWAAATWLGYLYFMHENVSEGQRGPKRAMIVLIVCFLLLQMCWYGVNWLPSAAGALHSY